MNILGILAQPSVTPFVDPTSISDLYLWLDADDASTFTYSSGTVVSQWNDKSGNAYNATQATVANQPSRVTSPSTGVDYDGSNDVLSTTASFNGAAFSIFVVLRDADMTAGSTIIGSGSGGDDIYFPYMANDNYYIQTGVNYGVVNVTQPTGLYAVEMLYNGAGSTNADKAKMRINGTNRTLSFTGTILSTISRSGQDTPIGAYNFTPILPFAGILSELVVYNRVLTATELTDIRDYLSTKWSITA